MTLDPNLKEVLVVAIPAVATLLAAVAIPWIAYQVVKLKTGQIEGKAKLEEIAVKVNGMSSSLVAASVEAAELVGADKERSAQKAREAERAIGSLAVKDSAGVPGPLGKEKNGAEAKLPPDKPAT